MTDAFFLGAGFSIAIDHAFMTTDALGVGAVKMLKSWHGTPPRDHSTICDGVSCDFPVLIDGHIPTPGANFETWLSRLAEPLPFLFGWANAHNQALFEKLTTAITTLLDFSIDQALENNPPDWLIDLINAWHAQEQDVVTFNYDPLVEATVDFIRPNDLGDGRRISHQALGPTSVLLPSWNVIHDPVAARSLHLYKLHGSVNWYWDERTRSPESMIEIGLPQGWGGVSDGGPPATDRVPGKVPVIVPPTAAKNPFLDNTTIRTVWRQAFETICRADRVFVIGYSLPPTDLLVGSMLTEAFRARPPEVYVIDIDGAVADRFRALGAANIDTTFCGPGDPVPRFARWYCSQVPSSQAGVPQLKA